MWSPCPPIPLPFCPAAEIAETLRQGLRKTVGDAKVISLTALSPSVTRHLQCSRAVFSFPSPVPFQLCDGIIQHPGAQ